ncbi:MAG: lysozyme inhibitor LprI family protein [Rickettsia sp.]
MISKNGKIMKKAIIFCWLFLSSISYAFAVDCNHALTQGDMNYCAGEEYKKVDKKLRASHVKHCN